MHISGSIKLATVNSDASIGDVVVTSLSVESCPIPNMSLGVNAESRNTHSTANREDTTTCLLLDNGKFSYTRNARCFNWIDSVSVSTKQRSHRAVLSRSTISTIRMVANACAVSYDNEDVRQHKIANN